MDVSLVLIVIRTQLDTTLRAYVYVDGGRGTLTARDS